VHPRQPELLIHVAAAHVAAAHVAAAAMMATMMTTMMAVVTPALSLTSILAHISPTHTAAHVAAHITAVHVAAVHVAAGHIAVLREDECAEAHHERQNKCKFFHDDLFSRSCKGFGKALTFYAKSRRESIISCHDPEPSPIKERTFVCGECRAQGKPAS